MAMNQSCYALVGRTVSSYFVFLLARYLVESIKKNASGGVFDAITTDTFRSLRILVPTKNIEKEFSEVVTSIFEKILQNSLQIQTLSTIRDTLLPKLMKGEIRVKDFDK